VSWVRLRQVALVAADLPAVVGALHDAFGLEVAFRDPGVAAFGRENAVLPVGDQFVEVVAPTRSGTAAGRQLERLGGDGGYMVIGHTDDHPALRARLEQLGVRTVIDTDHDGYRILQLHPQDTGGSFLELDFQPGGEDPSGPWMPAGPSWQELRHTEVVSGIAGVTVQTRDPSATAARWAAITGGALDGDDALVLALDGGTVKFVDGPVESLIAVSVTAADPARRGEQHTIGGVTFTFT
jgi:hypothetical protein